MLLRAAGSVLPGLVATRASTIGRSPERAHFLVSSVGELDPTADGRLGERSYWCDTCGQDRNRSDAGEEESPDAVCGADTVPPITGAAQQYGFKIVATQHGADVTKAAENIIVPKDSPIQTLSDLKGKKIAIPQGSSAHGLALLALKSVGLTPKDVQLVYLSPAAGATAFNTGKVDAWSIWNPQSAIAVGDGARIIAKGLPPIDQVNNYYVATDKSLNDPTRRAALTDVLTRVARIFNWAQQNPDEYAKAIVKETGVPLKDARATVDAYPFKVAQVLPADIKAEQDLSDAFLEAGEITKQVDVKTITDNLLPDGFDSSQSS